MDWMFSNTSTTAQRGALDWAPRFKDAVAPLFEELYESVVSGKETQRVLEANSAPDYRSKLQTELDVIKDSEMWRTGIAVRALRPEKRSR
jgi:ketol-acid reductoisomerase